MENYLSLKYIGDLGIRDISTGTVEFSDLGIKTKKIKDNPEVSYLVTTLSFYDSDKDLYTSDVYQLFEFNSEHTLIEKLDISERIIEYLLLIMNKLGTKDYTELEFSYLMVSSYHGLK